MPVRYFEWFIRGRSCLRLPIECVRVYVPIKAFLRQPRTLPLARYVILLWVESFPYSHPSVSLKLLWRRPPCARESSCLRAHLPTWRDVAAERHAAGRLNADPYFSNPSLIL